MMWVAVLLVLSTAAAALETVLSADPEDPVLAAALAELGPGWQLLPHTTHCQQAEPRQERYTDKILHTLVGGYFGELDSWRVCGLTTHCRLGPPCRELIQQEGGCVDRLGRDPTVVQFLLSRCRAECRLHYTNTSHHNLPPDIVEYGGLGDFLPQPFGFQLPVCSLREGFLPGGAQPSMINKPLDFRKSLPEVIRKLELTWINKASNWQIVAHVSLKKISTGLYRSCAAHLATSNPILSCEFVSRIVSFSRDCGLRKKTKKNMRTCRFAAQLNIFYLNFK